MPTCSDGLPTYALEGASGRSPQSSAALRSASSWQTYTFYSFQTTYTLKIATGKASCTVSLKRPTLSLYVLYPIKKQHVCVQTLEDHDDTASQAQAPPAAAAAGTTNSAIAFRWAWRANQYAMPSFSPAALALFSSSQKDERRIQCPFLCFSSTPHERLVVLLGGVVLAQPCLPLLVSFVLLGFLRLLRRGCALFFG